jgi:hypothetical protein
MRVIPQDATSVTEYLFIRDASDGTPLTGLAYNSGGAGASYVRPLAARQAITLASLGGPTSAWSSGGFVEVDATNMPGLYRIDIPNAAFVAGAGRVIVQLKFTGALVEPLDIALTALPDIEVGTVQTNGSNTATAFETNLAGSDDAHYDNTYLLFRTGANAGVVRKVSGFVASTNVITMTAAFPSTPSSGDVFVVINQ